jgi:hypothetical protein
MRDVGIRLHILMEDGESMLGIIEKICILKKGSDQGGY